MNILSSLRTGFSRALRSWKGILVMWFTTFMLVTVLMYPLKSSVSSSFGSTMITEKLADGFDLEVFADLGPVLKSIVSYLSAGLLILYITGFILNSFLTAGIFSSVRKESGKFSAREFFTAGSVNFIPFFVISILVTIILIILGFILIGIPFIITVSSETISEKSAFIINISGIVAFLVVLPLILLVADYSRAWKTSNGGSSCFRAIGSGFRYAFRYFIKSYLTMILLLIPQILLGIVILFSPPQWRPGTGPGVFLLLIVSQFLLFTRILLKTWRYASVTSLMEAAVK